MNTDKNWKVVRVYAGFEDILQMSLTRKIVYLKIKCPHCGKINEENVVRENWLACGIYCKSCGAEYHINNGWGVR